LQEPLRMITSYVQLLAKRYKDKLDDDANDFIEYAVDGSNRMRILISSLLEYSRVNRMKPFEKIDLNELLEDVLKNLKDQIYENNAIIKINTLPVISGDPVLISQLFQNLIANAIKFRRLTKPQIIISCKQENNEYLFSVKDNGIGIQKAYKEKIFIIFQRLHNKEKYPGTGIGLAICKKIVERHGGKIWLESELDKGSTFHFTIKNKE
jgi:light-regulated signal transduction histidine kinase (bacteriophytochrome)